MQRVTQKALKTITNIKPNDLYKQAEYVDTSTGEYVSGTEGRKIERQKATQKARETRERKKKEVYSYADDIYEEVYTPTNTNIGNSNKIIVNNFYEYLKSFPRNLTAPLSQLVKNLEHTNGSDDVAEMLQSLPENFLECLARYGYDSKGAVDDFSTQLIEYMPNISDEYKKDLMEQFEFHEMGYDIADED